jgi:hypothetical protein
MRRSTFLGLAALALLMAGPGLSETGPTEATTAAQVSVSIPSLHGADIPSPPAESSRVAFASTRQDQSGKLELPALRVMSSNGDASVQLVRRVRDSGAVALSSSGGRSRAREEVSTSSRSGATGWTELRDALEIPVLTPASRGPKRVTVIYEVWSF